MKWTQRKVTAVLINEWINFSDETNPKINKLIIVNEKRNPKKINMISEWKNFRLNMSW